MSFKKGCISWNKGLKRTWKSATEFKKGNIPWNKGLKGTQIAWNKGKEFSEKTRERMSISARKRERIPLSDETKQKIRLSNTGKKASLETIEKLKISHLGKPSGRKGKIVSEETLRKWIKSCNMKPNKPEKFLDDFLQKNLNGEYQINVRADVMTVGGKIPDFVNINGKKKLIELYGDFWHRNDNPQDRIDYFKKYGWDTLVIWEKELKDKEKLKEKIQNF